MSRPPRSLNPPLREAPIPTYGLRRKLARWLRGLAFKLDPTMWGALTMKSRPGSQKGLRIVLDKSDFTCAWVSMFVVDIDKPVPPLYSVQNDRLDKSRVDSERGHTINLDAKCELT